MRLLLTIPGFSLQVAAGVLAAIGDISRFGEPGKLVVLIWQILTKDQPYSWAPPLRTHEKIRHLEIMAGKPKHKSGPQPGQPAQGGRRGAGGYR